MLIDEASAAHFSPPAAFTLPKKSALKQGEAGAKAALWAEIVSLSLQTISKSLVSWSHRSLFRGASSNSRVIAAAGACGAAASKCPPGLSCARRSVLCQLLPCVGAPFYDFNNHGIIVVSCHLAWLPEALQG